MKKIYLLILFSLSVLLNLHAKNSLPFWGGSGSPMNIMDNNPIKILAYPNPTKDRLFVESESPLHSISIYNLLGQKIKHFSLEGFKKMEIIVNDIPSGTYILTAQSGSQTISQKFTKID